MFITPETAGPLIQNWINTNPNHAYLKVILRFQDELLEREDSACGWAPFALVSDSNMETLVLYDEAFSDFIESLGYYNEMSDRYHVCFAPTDDTLYKQYVNIYKEHAALRQASPRCQRDYLRALDIMNSYPTYESGPGPWGAVFQFTWIRFKDYVEVDGEIIRKFILDSHPRNLSDLNMALQEIRQLPCVQNVWYNLD